MGGWEVGWGLSAACWLVLPCWLMLGPDSGNLRKLVTKYKQGPASFLTNHKTTLPQVWIRWRRKGKGPKFGPGVEWYGGDAAGGQVPVLLAADRPSALSTEIINCNLNYENHEDLQHNVLK